MAPLKAWLFAGTLSLAAAPAFAAPVQYRGGREFLWRSRPAGRRHGRQGDQHPVEPRPGSASVRSRSFHGPGAESRQGGDRQWHRLRPLDGETDASDPAAGRVEIVAADVAGKKDGDNPHLWYAPDVMKAVAARLADSLSTLDAPHKAVYDKGAKTFQASLKPIEDKIAAMKAKYANVPVTASEPVFGYMADALGLDMHNKTFQLAVMNNTEPSALGCRRFRGRPQEPQGQGHAL